MPGKRRFSIGLSEEAAAELRLYSLRTSFSESHIVEEALKFYFKESLGIDIGKSYNKRRAQNRTDDLGKSRRPTSIAAITYDMGTSVRSNESNQSKSRADRPTELDI